MMATVLGIAAMMVLGVAFGTAWAMHCDDDLRQRNGDWGGFLG